MGSASALIAAYTAIRTFLGLASVCLVATNHALLPEPNFCTPSILQRKSESLTRLLVDGFCGSTNFFPYSILYRLGISQHVSSRLDSNSNNLCSTLVGLFDILVLPSKCDLAFMSSDIGPTKELSVEHLLS